MSSMMSSQLRTKSEHQPGVIDSTMAPLLIVKHSFSGLPRGRGGTVSNRNFERIQVSLVGCMGCLHQPDRVMG